MTFQPELAAQQLVAEFAPIPEPDLARLAHAGRYLEEMGFKRHIAGAEDFQKAAYALARVSLSKKGLLVMGTPGVGKTKFIDAVTRRTGDNRGRIWISLGISGWEEKCSPDYWRANHGLELFTRHLVLDDLGSDYVTNNFGTREDRVGRLIMDYHLRGRGRLFVTTNFTPDDFITKRDNRIMSRLQGLCMAVNFTGKCKRDMLTEGLR